MSVKSLETETQRLKLKVKPRGHLGLGQWVGNLVGAIKDATVAI